MSSKKLMNDPSKIVEESLQGLVSANPGLALLENHQVVLRSDLENVKGKVALISGGGSGHEPAHAGYVGRGMLTGAVCGAVFTSPPVSSILATLQAIWDKAQPSGILMIVKNYTGDRVNFGLALERAPSYGIHCPVNMVVVADDCALTSQDKSAGRRGLAGTVLVHKVAGAMAEHGKTLDEIVQTINDHMIGKIGTIGLSLSPCCLPGKDAPSFQLQDDEIELGLGIHGEAGVKRLKVQPISEAVKIMLDHMESSIAKFPVRNGRFIVLINNLGGTSNLEMGVVAKQVISELKSRNSEIARIYMGPLMTALEMAGISITLCPAANDDLLQLVDVPTSAPGWPNSSDKSLESTDIKLRTIPSSSTQASTSSLSKSGGSLTKFGLEVAEKAIFFSCEALKSCEQMLNRFDSGAGDGDCGSTMKRGAESILKHFSANKYSNIADILQMISCVAEEDMGGTAGAMYSILFATAASIMRQKHVTPESLILALGEGVEKVMKYGGAEPGDRTMLDALVPAIKSFLDPAKPLQSLEKATVAAEEGAVATKDMKTAKAGRASYVSPDELKNPDAGAHAVGIVFRAVYQAVLAKCRESGYDE